MNYRFELQASKAVRIRSLFAAVIPGEVKRAQKVASLIAAFVLLLAVPIASAQAATFRVLHQFNGAVGDGANPEGALVQDATGNLYGTTFAGGAGQGVVYKIDSSTGGETVLFTFDTFVSGANPATPLLLDQTGDLFGIADEGPGGAGVVFKVAQDGQENHLFDFQGGLGTNARVPSGGLVMDKFGNSFGTTLFGGPGSCTFGCGTVFRLDSAGTLHLRYRFSGGADGSKPSGPLVRDANGNLYGVATQGGDLSCPESPQSGCGTVFKLANDGVFTVLHTFTGGADGAVPQPGLLMDAAGNLYGAAARGGFNEHGTVFKISKNGRYTILHRFGRKEGSNPNGGLVLDPAGNLYGTAQTGGANNLGTVFELSAAGQLTVLHDFSGLDDGAFPLAGVIRDAAGHLFGTTVKNFLIQQVQGGNVFEITP